MPHTWSIDPLSLSSAINFGFLVHLSKRHPASACQKPTCPSWLTSPWDLIQASAPLRSWRSGCGSHAGDPNGSPGWWQSADIEGLGLWVGRQLSLPCPGLALWALAVQSGAPSPKGLGKTQMPCRQPPRSSWFLRGVGGREQSVKEEFPILTSWRQLLHSVGWMSKLVWAFRWDVQLVFVGNGI